MGLECGSPRIPLAASLPLPPLLLTVWPTPPLSKVSDDQDRYELELNFQVPIGSQALAQWPLVMKIHNVTQFNDPNVLLNSQYTMENVSGSRIPTRDLLLRS